jgi:hypothetical protein
MGEPRKAAMVSNLMVVLCSEHNAQPVLNTGVGTAYRTDVQRPRRRQRPIELQ